MEMILPHIRKQVEAGQAECAEWQLNGSLKKSHEIPMTSCHHHDFAYCSKLVRYSMDSTLGSLAQPA